MKAAAWLLPALLVALCAFGGWRLCRRRWKAKKLRQLAGQGVLLDAAPVKGFHYVEGNEQILPLLRQGEPLILRREPENIHDCNAIRLLRRDGQPIGYLPMAYNAIPAALLDRGILLEARLDLGRPGKRRWLEAHLFWPGCPASGTFGGPKGLGRLWKEEGEESLRPGAQGVRLLAAEQLQQLCRRRPSRWGGLFLDLFLLEPERLEAPAQPAIPLLDGQGQTEGQLPLYRLPVHRRRMAAGMLARGQRLFACLDQQVSLPSARLWCAALYWEQGEEKETDEKENLPG